MYNVKMKLKLVFLFYLLKQLQCENDFFIARQSTKNQYFCVTNTSYALTWNVEDVTASIYPQVSTFIPQTYIQTYDFDLTEHSPINPWYVTTSVKSSINEVILDHRWEKIDVLTTKNNQYLQYTPVLSNLEADFDIPLSIRIKYEAHIFLCDGPSPPESNCYWFMLHAYSGSRSAVRKCEASYIPKIRMHYPSPPCSQFLVLVEQHPTFLFSDRWSHFKLSKKRNLLTFTQNGKNLVNKILEWEDNNKIINVSHMIIHSKNTDGLWKIHNLKFVYTNKEANKIQFGPAVFPQQDSICISMFISMCKTCSMKLELMARNTILGERTYIADQSGWMEIKFLVDNIRTNTTDIKLLVSTIGTSQNRFWAVDGMRQCQPKELRIISLKEKATCQLMSGEKKVITFKNAVEVSGSTCSEDTIGPFCVPCSWIYIYCRQISICTSHNCVCSAGYSGDSCLEQCEVPNYGHGCRKLCGKCFDGLCNPSDGTCDACIDKYIGPKCDIPSSVVFKNAPKILKIGYTDVSVSITDSDVENMMKDQPNYSYIIQYKKANDVNKASIYSSKKYNLNHNNDIIIDNLEAGTTYFLRCIVVANNNIMYNGSYVKYTTFTTKCNDISESDLNIYPTNTSVFLSVIRRNTTCKIDKYQISIYNHSNRAYLNETGVFFDDLRPFTEYKIIFRSSSRNQERVFQTNEGVPTPVQNLNVTSNSTTISLRWNEPITINGKFKHYIVECQQVSHVACGSSRPSRKYSFTFLNTSAVITNLIPYSDYFVAVSVANRKYQGPAVKERITTSFLNKIESEEELTVDKISQGVNKVIVKLSNINCDKIRGPLDAYVTISCIEKWCNDRNSRIFHITWPFNQVVYRGVIPFSDYEIALEMCRRNTSCTHVQRKSSFKSKSGSPHQVRDLSVFSKNNTSISLRWKQPYPPTGIIEKYIISYNITDYSENVININRCELWKDFDCAVLTGLIGNASYEITVAALNTNVGLSGEFSKIEAVTKTDKSEAPYDLHFVWTIQNDLNITWKHPNNTNGQIKFFTITITHNKIEKTEEVLKLNENNYTLLYNYLINAEKLLPSISYTIQISANNGYMGKIVSKDVISPPSIPILKHSPKITCVGNTFVIEIIPEIINRTKKNNYGLLTLISDNNTNSYIKQKVKIHEQDLLLRLSKSKIIKNFDQFNQNLSIVVGSSTNFSIISGMTYNITVVVTNNLEDKTSYKIYFFSCSTPKANLLLLALLLLIIIPLVIIFIKRNQIKKCLKREEKQFANVRLRSLSSARTTEPEGRNTYDYASNEDHVTYSRRINVSQFKKYVEETETSNDLAIQHSLILDNRSCSVTYIEVCGNQYFDYIDMEFCDGFKIPRAYVVAETPKTDSINDFWKIVWEQNIQHMVLFTSPNLKQSDKFLPDKNEPIQSYNISIQLAFEKRVANYEFKTFILIRDDEIRHVDQIEFSYQGLNSLQFVPLLNKMGKFSLDSHSPILVHSRGNFERIGFILLCDMSLRMAEKRQIDVWRILKQLSDYKMGLICNIEMYKLAHVVILQCLFNTKFDVDTNNIYENF